MSSFNERLARLADQVRELDGGIKLAMELMRLAADVDSHLEQQSAYRHNKLGDAFTKWNEFLNASIEEAYRYGKQQIVIERRNMARAVASDPRWQGGYGDALKLFEKDTSDA